MVFANLRKGPKMDGADKGNIRRSRCRMFTFYRGVPYANHIAFVLSIYPCEEGDKAKDEKKTSYS